MPFAAVQRKKVAENRDQYLTPPAQFSDPEGTTASAVVTSSRRFPTDTKIGFYVVPLNGATPGVDYTVPTSPITLLAGQLSVTLSVDILSDAVVDPGESLKIKWLWDIPS